jgi:hypothetical protein
MREPRGADDVAEMAAGVNFGFYIPGSESLGVTLDQDTGPGRAARARRSCSTSSARSTSNDRRPALHLRPADAGLIEPGRDVRRRLHGLPGAALRPRRSRPTGPRRRRYKVDTIKLGGRIESQDDRRPVRPLGVRPEDHHDRHVQRRPQPSLPSQLIQPAARVLVPRGAGCLTTLGRTKGRRTMSNQLPIGGPRR